MNQDVQEIGQLLASVQDQVKAVRGQLGNFSSLNKGYNPPQMTRLESKLARFETALKKKGESLIQGIIQNHGATTQDLSGFKLPTIASVGKEPIRRQPVRLPRSKEASRPVKSELMERKTTMLISNPQNELGKKFLREKFNIPPPQQSKIRSCGQKMDLFGKLYSAKTAKPQRILTKEQRNDPFADPPPITDYDLSQGMLSLVNRGMIPREVDLTPAFARGVPALKSKPANIVDKAQLYTKQGGDPTFMTGVKMIEDQREIRAIMSSHLPQQKPETPLALPEIQSQEIAIPGTNVGQIQSPDPEANPRAYDELMDAYSLHQFIIRRGKVVENTPEYLSYKRSYAYQWGDIFQIIQALEKILAEYNIPMAYIDGKKVAKFALDPFRKPTVNDLLSCLANQGIVQEFIKNPGRLFSGSNGKELAATYISKTWRMYAARQKYKSKMILRISAHRIQAAYRRYKISQAFREIMLKKYYGQTEAWTKMMEEFKKRWPKIRKSRRVEIHITNLTSLQSKKLTMEKIKQRENLQITRLFAMKNPLVDIIYVSPLEMSSEIIGYYAKVLEIGNIEHPENRFHIIVPEKSRKLPRTLSTTTQLLYSPSTIKKIKQLIHDQEAYIVPGVVTRDDIKLSIELGIPIMSGDPEISQLYSSKSGGRRIFNLADVPIPLGAYDIYQESDFETQLAKLILSHSHIETWVFKIDDESSGRGTAWLETQNIKQIRDLRKNKFEINDKLVEQIKQVLHREIPIKAKIAMPSLFSDWNKFIKEFCRIGGVIESQPNAPFATINSPSIAFFIEPDGNVEVLGSFDRFSVRPFVNGGCSFPQTSLPGINMETITQAVGGMLYQKGIIGHVTIDLLSFPYPSSGFSHPLFWGVDINCWLTDYASTSLFFDFLMEGKLDSRSGAYSIEQIADSQPSLESKTAVEPRCFVYCKYLSHPGLSTIQYKTFFQMCREEMISFDLEKRQGTTFVLCDSLQSGMISIISIGSHRVEALRIMDEALSFIQRQAGPIDGRALALVGPAQDQLLVTDIISKVRQLSKQGPDSSPRK